MPRIGRSPSSGTLSAFERTLSESSPAIAKLWPSLSRTVAAVCRVVKPGTVTFASLMPSEKSRSETTMSTVSWIVSSTTVGTNSSCTPNFLNSTAICRAPAAAASETLRRLECCLRAAQRNERWLGERSRVAAVGQDAQRRGERKREVVAEAKDCRERPGDRRHDERRAIRGRTRQLGRNRTGRRRVDGADGLCGDRTPPVQFLSPLRLHRFTPISLSADRETSAKES